MNRREFIYSAGAASLLSGCRTSSLFASPDLRFGVVSDIHITTRKSCRLLERSFRYFRRRGVDAVVIPGDLTDWGLRSGLVYVKECWDAVFAGTDIVPLFCTGNHDYDGWWYGDMTMEMHANGYSEDENLPKLGMAKVWKEVFGEDFAPVRCRAVKGYDFLSCEYEAHDGKALTTWLAANGKRLAGDRPFFFFQHLPISGTTVDGGKARAEDAVRAAVAAYPNCIAITGHTHCPFIDERLIWQGEFTSVAAPSLSYACFPSGHENGEGNRAGKSRQAMTPIPTRRDLRGGQGFVFDVWPDRVVIERIDLEEESEGAPDWTVPLPVRANQPYRVGRREASEPVPEFPKGATLDFETRNTENRSGFWTIVMDCRFPSASMPRGHRVFDYEIRAAPKDGSQPIVKRFLSPAYPKHVKYEPESQRFWFDVAELPQDRDYVLEVRAFNCFGKSGTPLVSPVLHGKPGLGTARREQEK